MCLFDSPTDTTTTSGGPDALTQQIRRAILPFAFQIAGQSFPGYDPSARVEGFSPDQSSAFDYLRDYAGGGDPGYYTEAARYARSYGDAPASRVTFSPTNSRVTFDPSAGRVRAPPAVVGEDSYLGKISGWMSPYTEGVLQPQIREISDAATRNRIRSGEEATFAKAFGDARHGVADSLTNREEMRAVGDVTGQAYQSAYDRAMAERNQAIDRRMSTDALNQQLREANLGRGMTRDITNQQLREANLNRGMTRDITNQQLREQMLGRRMGAGTSLMDFGTANSADRLQRINALLNAGTMQQQLGQSERDAAYENYQRGVEWPFRQWDVLLSMLSGQPSTQQITSTRSGGSSGLWGILGSLLGGFAPGLG